jgi:ATP-binding cassette, subfamily F, member 3
MSIYDNFLSHGLPYSRERVGSIISTYGFTFADYTKIVGNLSGGERSRLLFAILSQNTLAWKHSKKTHNPENEDIILESSSTSNILIFDEPTNHLDADTRESLEKAIREYPGSLLFISHDRYFVNKLAQKIWIIEDGELMISYGNYEDYRYKRERGIDLDMSLFNVDGEMDLVLEEKLGVVEARRIKEKFARRQASKRK